LVNAPLGGMPLTFLVGFESVMTRLCWVRCGKWRPGGCTLGRCALRGYCPAQIIYDIENLWSS